MGETLNGNTDLSSTNGFTSKVDQTGSGWPMNMVGAMATQRAEWIALMAKNGFPGADPKNLNGLGGPMQSPTNVIANPGKAVEAPNAETSLVKNADGSVVGRMERVLARKLRLKNLQSRTNLLANRKSRTPKPLRRKFSACMILREGTC